MAEQFGKYTLLRRIGKGGMAEVYLASARSMGGFEKILAIKRLLSQYSSDKEIISMLADEAHLSVWLVHPNILQVFDFGRVEETYYIAMEFVEGCDLCDLIRPEGRTPGQPLPLGIALYTMIQVAEALDYAHKRCNGRGEHLGIIHRDVSPHNVLLSTGGEVKLADFGLARAAVSVHHSRTGVIRGKFSYMPKEQATGKKFDHRIDIFAAGATLYEALTGIKPYTAQSLSEQLKQLDQVVPPPSRYGRGISPELDRITMKALSPMADGRYGSAEEFSNALTEELRKISTLPEEAKKLATLVKIKRQMTEGIHGSLPPMSLADVVIDEASLIEDELRAVQQEQAQKSVSKRPVSHKDAAAKSPAAMKTAAAKIDDSPALDKVFPGLNCDISEESEDLFPLSLSQTNTRPRSSSPKLNSPVGPTGMEGAAAAASDSPANISPTNETSDEELDNQRTIQQDPEQVAAAVQRAHQMRQASESLHFRQKTASSGLFFSKSVLSAAAVGIFILGILVGWILHSVVIN